MRYLKHFPFLIGLAATWSQVDTIRAEEPDSVKVFDKAIRSMLYISATSADGKIRRDLVGIVLDLDQKLVVTNYIDEKEVIHIAFPEFGEDRKVKTSTKHYRELTAKAKARTGFVLHGDKRRNLALIQLEKACPATVSAATLAEKAVVGATVWHIGRPITGDTIWQLSDGKVRYFSPKMDREPGPALFISNPDGLANVSASAGGDSNGLLFDRDSRVLGLPRKEKTGGSDLVGVFIFVQEIRDLLKEKKIEIKGAAAFPEKK